MHILTIAPTRLGDTLFCTPAYRHIKQTLPDARLTVVALTGTAYQALEGNPHIDCLVMSPAPRELAGWEVDRVLHLHHLAVAEPLLAAIDAPIARIGPQNDAQHCAEQTAWFVAQQVGGEPDGKGYDLFPNAHQSAAANDLYGSPVPGGVVVGLHLGCHGLHKKKRTLWRRTAHAKAWPLRRFIEFAGLMREQCPSVRWFVTGSGEEQRLAQRFIRNVEGAVNLVDATDVGTLAALMRRLDLFLCADTGPIHVACAADVPLIGLYGPTEFHRTGPYPTAPHRRAIRTDDLHRLAAVEVAAAAKDMLQRR